MLNLKFMSRWKPAVKYVELANGIVIDTGYGYKAIRKDGETFWIEKFKPYCIEQVDEFLNEVKIVNRYSNCTKTFQKLVQNAD